MTTGWILYLVFPLFCLGPGLLCVLLFARRSDPGTGARHFCRDDARVAPTRAAQHLQQWHAPPVPLSLGEFLFRAVVLGFLFHSAVAFVLAEIGWLTPGTFLGLAGGLALLLGVVLWRRRPRVRWPRPAWGDLVPLALLLLAPLLLGAPHPAILGGSDPGVYVGIAANVARTGSLRAVDPVWAGMDAALAEREFLFANLPGLSMSYHRLPGYYAIDHASGALLPQFYHLYPLWLALGLFLVGFPAGLYLTPVLACWGLVAVTMAGRKIVGRWPALAAGLLLGLNPLFIWLGRHPISEIPALFLMFALLYGLAAFQCSAGEDRGAGILAGAALGALMHTRTDSVLALGLVGLWVAWQWLMAGRRASWLLPFVLPVGLSLVHWGFYLAFFTWGYTVDALGGAFHFLLAPVVWPVAFLAAGMFALLAVLSRRGRLERRLPTLRLVAALGVVLLVAFAWFVWPALSPPQENGVYAWNAWSVYQTADSLNLVHLSWYLLPAGLGLGVLGLCLALLDVRLPRIGFAAGLALLYGFFYLYRSADYPILPYIMRRYYVVLIPVLVLMMGYALYRLVRGYRWAGRLAAAALLFLLAGTFSNAAQLPRQVNDYDGITEQVAGLAERFAPRDVLLFTDVPTGLLLAFPLQYLYQRTSFVFQRPQPDSLSLQRQVAAWRSEGRSVFVLVSPGESRLSPGAFSLEWQGTFSLHWRQLEYPMDHLPQETVEQEIRYDLYRVAGAEVSSGQGVVDVGAGDYPYLVEGFWPPERTADGMTFRWTDGDAVVELPGRWFASPAPLTLTLALQVGWEPRADDRPLEIWLDGVLLGQLRLDAQMRTYALPVPPELQTRLAGQDVTRLRLRGSTWRPAADGVPDQRELGVVVDLITVR